MKKLSKVHSAPYYGMLIYLNTLHVDSNIVSGVLADIDT